MIKVNRNLFSLQRHQSVTWNIRTKQSRRHCGAMIFGRETLPMSNHKHLQINKATENLVSDCHGSPCLLLIRFGFFTICRFLGSDVRNTSGSESSCALWPRVAYKGRTKLTIRCHETQWMDTQRDHSSEAKLLLPQAQSKTEPLKSVDMTGCNCNLY